MELIELFHKGLIRIHLQRRSLIWSQMETETEGGVDDCVEWNKLTSLFTSISFLSLGLAGIGYSVFSHGNLTRALEMKSPPPPLNLGSENLRGDASNQGMGVTRANHSSAVSNCCYHVLRIMFAVGCKTWPLYSNWNNTPGGASCCANSYSNLMKSIKVNVMKMFPSSGPQRGFLYQGLHSGSSVVAMGKAGLLGHSLGGYGLSSPVASGTCTWLHQFHRELVH